MSTDASAPSARTPGEDLPREEGIETTTETLPKPADHGGAGMFVLNDDHLASDELPHETGEYQQVPDASLYQHARAAWYARESDVIEVDGTEKIVLCRDYEVAGEDHAVSLTSSRWRAGRGTGDDYRAFFKYDLTLQPLDEDGQVEWDRTPVEALSVKIQPQIEGLVDSSGDDLSLPFGTGTLCHVTSTWVDRPELLGDRAGDLVAHALGYDHGLTFVAEDSRRFWKAESHVRFAEAKLDDVVQTLRQSADLFAQHAAEFETDGVRESHQWLEAKITTRDWEKLGFPQLDANILLKVYMANSAERAPYPFDQPKIEAALLGNPGGEKRHWDEWDDIMQALREIVLSHLRWAGVGPTDLVADDYYEGVAGEPYEWEHPEGRRFWLQQHYESLVPDLYREATKESTTLVYDILDAVQRHGRVTYQQLVDETGAAYRTVRYHVRRLSEDVGGDDPGLLERIRDVETWVAFSAQAFEDDATDALDEVRPDDTPTDREDRAEERRERRQEREETGDDTESDDATDSDEEADTEQWETFDDLAVTVEQFARALREEFVDHGDVRVRTDPYAIFGGTG